MDRPDRGTRWFFCEHCKAIALPYIPNESGKIKTISTHCVNCKKPPTEVYLLKVDHLTENKYFKKFWWPFDEWNCLNASMTDFPNMPEAGVAKFKEAIKQAKEELFINLSQHNTN